jgi:low affinity Fe/Cu permease
MSGPSAVSKAFAHLATAMAHAAGKPITFIGCCAIIIVWALFGPVFGFSDTWQLLINTGTTIITFLMVFLIQNSQNRDGAAIQAKLDELIQVSAAQNHYIGIEDLTEEELADIRRKCQERADAEVKKAVEKTIWRRAENRGSAAVPRGVSMCIECGHAESY